jgi:hypothetical protein
MLNDTTSINRNTSSTDGPRDTLPLVFHPPALHPSRPAKSSLILLVLGWFSGVEKQRHFTSVLHVTEGYVSVEGESHVLVTYNIG